MHFLGLHGLLGVLSLLLAGGLSTALGAAVDDLLAVLVHLQLHDADLKEEGKERLITGLLMGTLVVRFCFLRVFQCAVELLVVTVSFRSRTDN